MAQSLIPPPDKMETHGDTLNNWNFFKASWKNYGAAIELEKKSAAIQVGTLLSVMGKTCYQIYENLPMTEAERAKPDKIIEKLTEFFEPKRNTIYERYSFNLATQKDNESVEQFVHNLRKLASTCEYGTLHDELIRDRIVIGINDHATRSRLLRDSKLDLQKAIDTCRASEQAKSQMQKLEQSTDQVHFAKKKQSNKSNKVTNCSYCGGEHKRGQCPAYGTTCHKCNKGNHYAKVCKAITPKTPYKPQYKAQKVHQVNQNDSSSDESVYMVGTQAKKQYYVKLVVESPHQENVPLRFQIDSGATCSTMNLTDYNKLTSQVPKESKARLTLYDKTVINPVGQVSLRCTSGTTTKKVHFEIVKDVPVSLLSGHAAEALNLLTFAHNELVNQMTKEDILVEYDDLFHGLGRMPGTYHIDMDETVRPVKRTNRRVPVGMRQPLKDKLDQLEQDEIIRKVTTPTQWVNNIVVVKKPHKIRICLDPLELNKGIQRSHYPIPTIDEITPRLSNARMFTVVDAKDGFLQVVLDEQSSYLTTFWTAHGRYRWLRMPFGISSAPEEFQRRLDECLEGLENVAVIADDIIIYGNGEDDASAEKSHDNALKAVFDRCRQKGLKLNKDKVKYKLTSVAYMGHVLSSEGLKPDPEKIKAVIDMPKPENTTAVHRLLGVVTYLAKFMPNLSTVSEPLRRLTDKDVPFEWTELHDQSLSSIKELMTAAPILKYYDVGKPVTIECDSSEVGLGAVLMQDSQPIAYASRALSQTEKNYAQIEKECLAIVFATDRFSQYIMGKEVTVLSDHKPLMTIFKKPILNSPKRLQRMRLRLQQYNVNVIYKPGKEMYISDTLSRASLPDPTPRVDTPDYLVFEVNEQMLAYEELESVKMDEELFVSDRRLDDIRQHTLTDESLQMLMIMVSEGWPRDKQNVPLSIRDYWPYRDELSTQNGLVFRGTRIIIPACMRRAMVERAHQSHLGIQYTVNTAREIMFWPRMHTELVDVVQRCSTCQTYSPAQCSEPLMTYPFPKAPWQVVSSDCFELNKQNYCVLVDSYSDYVEVVELSDMTSGTLIRQLKPVFATHGIPMVLISDNGPNYASSEFAQFTKEWDFEHITTSPHHKQANGKAESAVKVCKSIIKKATGDIWLAILEWRNACTPGSSSSAVQRLMSRRTRSSVPANDYKPVVQQDVVNEVKVKRQKAKLYHDRSVKQLPELVVGQTLRAKLRPNVTRSTWSPAVVKEKVAPNSYIVTANGHDYRRNRVHLRESAELAKSLRSYATLPELENEHSGSTEVDSARADNPIVPMPEVDITQHPSPNKVVGAVSKPDIVMTRSGRVSKPPGRYLE